MDENLKILFFANNRVGYEILKYLKNEDECIIGLVLHPDSDAKFKKEMIALFPDLTIIEGNRLKESLSIETITNLNPDIFISVYFGYILSLELLKIPIKGAINLHPAYLPYNKGANPNVWAIIDGTPAGVTIHYMDEGIDTGSIIARREVDYDYIDTGKTLYEKLEFHAIELYKENWNNIKNNKISHIYPEEEGTLHYTKDFSTLNEIYLDKKYNALDLINILRAKTFPPHKGAYFILDGKKYYIEIKIIKDDNIL